MHWVVIIHVWVRMLNNVLTDLDLTMIISVIIQIAGILKRQRNKRIICAIIGKPGSCQDRKLPHDLSNSCTTSIISCGL
jgi:hypothetical protein